jgi:hypothetical protein
VSDATSARTTAVSLSNFIHLKDTAMMSSVSVSMPTY